MCPRTSARTPALSISGHRAQIDEEPVHALLEAGLNQLFELLGGAAGHQVLLRRQHELPRFGPLMKHWHSSGWMITKKGRDACAREAVRWTILHGSSPRLSLIVISALSLHARRGAIADAQPAASGRQIRTHPRAADVAAPPADATKTASGLAFKVLQKGNGQQAAQPPRTW